MFLGDFQHTLDAKGRVSLPAKFRSAIPGRVFITQGQEGCLYVYPPDGYQSFYDGLMGASDFDPRTRALKRFFMSGASETDLDSAGRISIPQALREHAGLTKEVSITGAGDRIEIWDAARWAEYKAEIAKGIEDAARGLVSDGQL